MFSFLPLNGRAHSRALSEGPETIGNGNNYCGSCFRYVPIHRPRNNYFESVPAIERPLELFQLPLWVAADHLLTTDSF